MNEYNLEFKNHMGAWFMDESICDKMLKYFYDNPQIHNIGKAYFGDEGGNNIVKDIKESVEIQIPSNFLGKPFDEYRNSLQIILEKYIQKYNYLDGVPKFNINEDYMIQTYPKGGGFKSWHAESCTPITCKRLLVFMTYLNDVPDGGTMFRDQDIIIPAKKGLTLIWPAGFTHVHKGQITDKHEKQIVTGWYSFNE